MGNDTPDWAGQYNTPSFYPLSDLAEMAVRLGSPFAFDRRGSVFWYDDFEWGIGNYTFAGEGTDGALSLITTPVYHGPFAAKMTSGPEDASQSSLIRSMEVVVAGKIGLFALYRVAGSSQEIIHRIAVWNGTNSFWADVKITYTGTVKVEVTNGAGYETLLTGAGPGVLYSTYAFTKLVIDTETRKLERVIFGPYEWDVSENDCAGGSATTEKLLTYTTFLKVLSASGLQTLYIDMIGITGAEPLN